MIQTTARTVALWIFIVASAAWSGQLRKPTMTGPLFGLARSHVISPLFIAEGGVAPGGKAKFFWTETEPLKSSEVEIILAGERVQLQARKHRATIADLERDDACAIAAFKDAAQVAFSIPPSPAAGPTLLANGMVESWAGGFVAPELEMMSAELEALDVFDGEAWSPIPSQAGIKKIVEDQKALIRSIERKQSERRKQVHSDNPDVRRLLEVMRAETAVMEGKNFRREALSERREELRALVWSIWNDKDTLQLNAGFTVSDIDEVTWVNTDVGIQYDVFLADNEVQIAGLPYRMLWGQDKGSTRVTVAATYPFPESCASPETVECSRLLQIASAVRFFQNVAIMRSVSPQSRAAFLLACKNTK